MRCQQVLYLPSGGQCSIKGQVDKSILILDKGALLPAIQTYRATPWQLPIAGIFLLPQIKSLVVDIPIAPVAANRRTLIRVHVLI